MSNDSTNGSLTPFNFEGAPVRVVQIDGEPYLVGKDVAERLGYADATTAIRSHCRGVQKLHPIPDSLGRVQEVRVLSEPDVLRLIVKSNLPAAERFERWVFEEVLPTIRKTGRYGAADPMAALNDAASLRTLLLASAERELTLQAKIEADKPKTGFFDRFMNADGLFGLQNAGRILIEPPNKFVGWLKQQFLFYQGGSLVPRAQYRTMGIFEVKATVVDDKARYQTYVTPKGLQYLAKKLGKSIPGLEEA